MQATYIQEGEVINYTPGSAVVAGQVVVQNNLVGIALAPIAANAVGALAVSGIFDVDQNAEIIPAGSGVYWDADGTSVSGVAGAGAATATATGNTFMGFAQAVTAATDSYVRIALRGAETAAAGVATATSITGTASTLPIAGLQAAQGGTATVTGGTSTTAGNAGGAVALTGGTPGATGVGGAATVAGGIGGATSGTGGAVTVAGGAGTNGNANGGAVSVLGGNANGSGTDGVVNVGTSNTSAVTIGATSIATSIPGPLTRGIGASTEAAGSTVADAGALPAATASVYPTTAANDSLGVKVHANDKVTGRMLFIGNGVANKILKVYGPSGAAINGAAADAAFSSVSGKGVIMVCLDSGANTWLAW
jgi:predicted RecA/RadA family phage recombinase